MNRRLIQIIGLIGGALLLVGCGTIQQNEPLPQIEETAQVVEPDEQNSQTEIAPLNDAKEETIAEIIETGESEVKVSEVSNSGNAFALQRLPPLDHELDEGEYVWNQLLARDSIRPIYEHELEFTDASSAPYEAEELVIGVEINGEAKAYAIGPLNSREMVNDTVGGIPILVTW